LEGLIVFKMSAFITFNFRTYFISSFS